MQKDMRSRDVIKMFSISKQTLLNWRKAGLPYSGSGQMLLYDEKTVRDWLNNRSDKVKEVLESNYDV